MISLKDLAGESKFILYLDFFWKIVVCFDQMVVTIIYGELLLIIIVIGISKKSMKIVLLVAICIAVAIPLAILLTEPTTKITTKEVVKEPEGIDPTPTKTTTTTETSTAITSMPLTIGHENFCSNENPCIQLVSPNYPNSYPTNTNEAWLIMMTVRTEFILQFHAFDVST